VSLVGEHTCGSGSTESEDKNFHRHDSSTFSSVDIGV
jgi:hypothetical protein